MPFSRERAADLARRMAERLAQETGVELAAEEAYVKSQLQRILLEWDREEARLHQEARARIARRARRVPEGSREWDLLLAEELEKGLQGLLGHGE